MRIRLTEIQELDVLENDADCFYLHTLLVLLAPVLPQHPPVGLGIESQDVPADDCGFRGLRLFVVSFGASEACRFGDAVFVGSGFPKAPNPKPGPEPYGKLSKPLLGIL